MMPAPTAVLLMTRPRAASERFVAMLPVAARARLRLCISPLLEIVRIAGAMDWGDAAGVIFTSANAVRVAASLDDRRDLPCYCVGEATARAARQAGWPARAMGANADELVAAMLAGPDIGPLLHPGGVHRRGAIAERLKAAGRAVREQAIYDQKAVPLSDAARRHLGGSLPVIAPLFSPRTSRHFAQQAGGGAPLLLAAMSPAVAESLAGIGATALEVAERPDAGAMAALVEKLLSGVVPG